MLTPEVEVVGAVGDDEGDDRVGQRLGHAAGRPRVQQAVAEHDVGRGRDVAAAVHLRGHQRPRTHLPLRNASKKNQFEILRKNSGNMSSAPSVVLPAVNEKKSVKNLVKFLKAALLGDLPYKYENVV